MKVMELSGYREWPVYGKGKEEVGKEMNAMDMNEDSKVGARSKQQGGKQGRQ